MGRLVKPSGMAHEVVQPVARDVSSYKKGSL